MDTVFLEILPLLIGFLGLGGALLGLFGLLARSQYRFFWLLAGLSYAIVVAGSGIWIGALGLSIGFWAPLLAGAVVPLVFHALQSPLVVRLVASALPLLRRPWVPWCVLLTLSPLLALWCVLGILSLSDEVAGPVLLEDPLHRPRMEQTTAIHAVTDLGRPIPVYHVPEDAIAEAGGPGDDASLLRDWTARVIRTAPPDCTSNCHGWVYTGGQFWVRGEDVELILADNGYRAVADPRVGDVVTYRDDTGKVAHSGVVRVADGELLLIEGKWGPLGRYLHRPEEQSYGTRFTYYRSERKGHLLHGLGGTSTEMPYPTAVPLAP